MSTYLRLVICLWASTSLLVYQNQVAASVIVSPQFLHCQGSRLSFAYIYLTKVEDRGCQCPNRCCLFKDFYNIPQYFLHHQRQWSEHRRFATRLSISKSKTRLETVLVHAGQNFPSPTGDDFLSPLDEVSTCITYDSATKTCQLPSVSFRINRSHYTLIPKFLVQSLLVAGWQAEITTATLSAPAFDILFIFKVNG